MSTLASKMDFPLLMVSKVAISSLCSCEERSTMTAHQRSHKELAASQACNLQARLCLE